MALNQQLVRVEILNINSRPECSLQDCRKKFPKTNVPRPADDAEPHFRSVFSTFSWADVWLQRASDHFGLTRRLQNWKWQMSTAFSGCGAAESAPFHEYLLCDFVMFSL